MSGRWWQVVDADQAGRIDEAVNRILDSPPYRDTPGLLERALRWLAERGILDGSFSWATTDIVSSLFQVAVIGLLAWFAWVVVRRIRTGAFFPAPTGDEAVVDHTGVARAPAEWLREAQVALQDGRHRDAVRAAYRAVVTQLVNDGMLPGEPGATVGAHRQVVASTTMLADLQARGFVAASDVFERVLYADAAADEADVAVVLEAAHRLEVVA